MTRWGPLILFVGMGVLLVVFPPGALILFLLMVGVASFTGDVHG